MFNSLKNLGRAIIPKAVFKLLQPAYHGAVAFVADNYFHKPSQKMFVIGVTGTAGKSTTVMMLSHILNTAGQKCGYITTVGYNNGNQEIINQHGLSMPGGWLLQKQLSEMQNNGCKFAIVECTSEGLAQNRHLGIKFQAALFTNLSPAHLDAHGSFDNYRKAKLKLFGNLTGPRTIIGGNVDDPNTHYFLGKPASVKFGVSVREDSSKPENFKTFLAKNISVSDKISFELEKVSFDLHLPGTFNVLNALLAIGMATELGVSLEASKQAINDFGKVPGRMEKIENNKGITIIVDYAPEPEALKQSLIAANDFPHEKLIHVFGATGGHRDVSKQFEFGRLTARYADTAFITNDDVYDSNPQLIADNIIEGIEEVGVPERKLSKYEVVLDRRNAIAAALKHAQKNDIVLITGKGSEQFLVLPDNQRIDWDERKIITELLNQIN